MSNVTHTKCDHCDKIVHDRCDAPGWVHIRGGSISRSLGRDKHSRNAISEYIDTASDRDYCCLKCLDAALKATVRKKEK